MNSIIKSLSIISVDEQKEEEIDTLSRKDNLKSKGPITKYLKVFVNFQTNPTLPSYQYPHNIPQKLIPKMSKRSSVKFPISNLSRMKTLFIQV